MVPNSNKEKEKGTRSCRQSFNSKRNEQAELIQRTQCHVQEEQIHLQQNAFHRGIQAEQLRKHLQRSKQKFKKPISFMRIKHRTRANDILCKTEY